jgi:two-component system chemotaxis response regulator CheB
MPGPIPKPQDVEAEPAQGAVVALAASAGGPVALAEVLGGLAGLPAPVLLIQHIDGGFMDGFVKWMARVSALPVRTARDGDPLRAGVVYVAPSGTHCRLGWGRRIALDPNPEGLHRPSADELFVSLSLRAGSAGIGVLLTGMGSDGAQGLLALRRKGGHTIVQDEQTSAVYGMPAAAAKLDAAVEILPLPQIAAAVMRAVTRTPSRSDPARRLR